MVFVSFFFIDFDKKGLYNQSYIEKDFCCLKPSKRGYNFVETLENLYFKSYVIFKQLQPKIEIK